MNGAADGRVAANSDAVGLCWQLQGEGDDQLVWHNGSTFGASSFVGIRVAAGLGAAALQNQSELMGMLVGNPSAAEAVGRALISPMGR